jgi:hypothetical protein
MILLLSLMEKGVYLFEKKEEEKVVSIPENSASSTSSP